MKLFQNVLYLGHRYVGLAMALFLTIAALTGSLLAFRRQIERFLTPHLHATARPGVPRLDVPTLVARAQEQVPNGTVSQVNMPFPDQALVFFTAKVNPARALRASSMSGLNRSGFFLRNLRTSPTPRWSSANLTASIDCTRIPRYSRPAA